METTKGERGVTALELIIALSVVGIVFVATVLSPSLGVQAGLTGIAILVNLRSPARG